MSRATDLLRILEAGEDPSQEATVKFADQLDAALEKAGMLKTVREGETGNMRGKLYNLKNVDGKVYALFSVPVITQGDASNSADNFKGVINRIWGLRQKGWYIDQPRGDSGWEDKNSGTSGTIMRFHVAAPKQQAAQQ